MILILSADPAKNFYHCRMLTPFGVKCLEFRLEDKTMKCLYIFPVMEKLNRNNRLVRLLAEALEKIFNSCEAEKAVFHDTPEGNLGILTMDKNTIILKADPVSGYILEKNYFIRNQNVVNIFFLYDSQSNESACPGKISYSELKNGLNMDLKRIPS